MANVTKIKFRRDTAANWSSKNPTPAAGEPCYETDTGKFKIGDGGTAYSSLPYISGGSTIVDSALSTTSTNPVQNKVITTALNGKLASNSANYIKSLSISGKTITYTKGDGSTGTLTTQDTTYKQATGTNLGLVKLYTSTGTSTDGTMDRNSITNALNAKLTSNSANYIKSMSISGKTITYTKGDGNTGTLTTQDTTYKQATTTVLGLVKLYTSTGTSTDGTMTRGAITTALNGKLNANDKYILDGGTFA